jgi:hypothetical protein
VQDLRVQDLLDFKEQQEQQELQVQKELLGLKEQKE